MAFVFASKCVDGLLVLLFVLMVFSCVYCLLYCFVLVVTLIVLMVPVIVSDCFNGYGGRRREHLAERARGIHMQYITIYNKY